MSRPFVRDRNGIRVALGGVERSAMFQLPSLVRRGGDAGGRLDYRAHPDHADREAGYRDLVGDGLAELRSEDHRLFLAGLEAGRLDGDQAEAWLRVIGEARLILAAGLGIDHDGWENEADPTSSPEMALLGFLGFLQERLIAVL